MKILIITDLLSPYRIDWFDELAKYMNVDVVYTSNTESSRNSEWLSKKPKRANCIPLDGLHFGKFKMYFNVIRYLRNKYDLILLDGYGSATLMLSILYLRYKKTKFIMNVDGGLIKPNENLFLKKIKSFFISSPTIYLSSSNETDKYLIYYGANSSKIYHHKFTSLFSNEIENSLIDENQKLELRKKYCIKEKKIILSVGRFIYSKGFDILIEATKNISKDYGVYIVGGLPPKEYISLKEKYKLTNLHFIDFKNKKDLKTYYKMADLFVLPTRSDVWGLVINEAMANGLPIITTNKCVAGLELIENGKNGYIVEVNNIDDLSNKMNEILENDSLRLSLAKESLHSINDYTIENMGITHKCIFEEFIKIY